MESSSHSMPDDPACLPDVSSKTALTSEENRKWHSAQERPLLYLRALNLAPRKALELALEALRCAEAELAGFSDRDPAAAMRCLRRLLRERGLESLLGSWIRQGSDKPFTKTEGSMPPLNRRSMVPEVFDRRPWISFMLRTFKGTTKTRSGVG